MKNIFVVLVLAVSGLASASAQADSVRISMIKRNARFISAEFRVDENRGTAWMELSFEESLGGPRRCVGEGPVVGGSRYPGYGPGYGYGRPTRRPCAPSTLTSKQEVAVPGLMYDAPSARILAVNSRGEKIVCASVSQQYARITRRPYLAINTTGACRALPRHDMVGSAIYFETN